MGLFRGRRGGKGGGKFLSGIKDVLKSTVNSALILPNTGAKMLTGRKLVNTGEAKTGVGRFLNSLTDLAGSTAEGLGRKIIGEKSPELASMLYREEQLGGENPQGMEVTDPTATEPWYKKATTFIKENKWTWAAIPAGIAGIAFGIYKLFFARKKW